MKFSVVLIARNEAKTLPRLLASLNEFKTAGGEVVVLDTGSTDGTAQIAKDWGCKVEEVGEKYLYTIDEEFAKQINDRFIVAGEKRIVGAGDRYFDFAAARNHCGSIASNDWLCTVDADEALTKFDFEKIEQILDNPNLAHLEYEFVFSHDQFDNPMIQFVQSKFFNRKKIQWTGIVHEVISPINGGGEHIYIGPEVFLLEHWQNHETNRHSYLKGLAVDCFLHPDNDRNLHYFARELFWAGRYRSCIREFERHLDMNRWPAERSESAIFMGDAFGRLNEPVRQLQMYSFAFMIDSTRRESFMKIARFYEHNKNWLGAIAYTKAAMEIPWSSFYANTKTHYTNEPHEILYRAYGWLGRIEEAKQELLKALKFQPHNQDYLFDTKFYFEYGDPGLEGWMTFPELTWLYQTSKQMRTVAELGSWKGKSTHALLTGGARVTAIDHFKGSEDPKDGTHDGNPYPDFMKNVGSFTNLTVKKMTGMEAAKEDGMYDLVFIDAGHTYQEVIDDIKAWQPHARMIIAGHDYSGHWSEVMKAVNDTFGKPDGLADTIWYKYLVPKVSFIIPQLGREDGLQRCINSIKKLKYPQELIEIIIEEGSDTVPVKVKRAVAKATGDLIVFASNDTEFTPDSLILAVELGMKTGKELISFNTGSLLPDEGNICEHFVITKNLADNLGDIFDTEFNHVGVDNLLWARAKKLNTAIRAEEAIVIHYHFTKGAEYDEVYEKGWANHQKDRELLKQKLAAL